MMAASGFRKYKTTAVNPVRSRKKKEIIIWNEGILLLAIWYPGMWPVVQRKNVVMQVMVWELPGRPFTWIMRKRLCVMARWNVIKTELQILHRKSSVYTGRKW